MTKVFLNIYRFFKSHTTLLWTVLAVIVALCLVSSARLSFSEDLSSFFPKEGENSSLNQASEYLTEDNRIIVNIKGENPDEMIEAVDYFVEDLNGSISEESVSSIMYRVDDEQIERVSDYIVLNLPLFLSDDDYQRIDTLLTEEKIRAQLKVDRSLLGSPIGAVRNLILSDPLFFSSNVLQKLSGFSVGNQYGTYEDYIFTKDKSTAVIIVSSQYPTSETLKNKSLIRKIRQSCDRTSDEFNVDASVFGSAVVSIENASQIKKDSIFAGILAIVLILTVLIYYYRQSRYIFLILISILFGALFSLGILATLRGNVSLIAVGLASVLLGVAINYPIHFLSHLRKTDNREEVIRDIVSPLLTGNITTVGAFMSLMFIDSAAMKDFGLFASMMLVGTILFVLIFLPHFMVPKVQSNKLAFRRIAELPLENNKSIVLVLTCLTFLIYFTCPKAGFDSDMHSINYMSDEQKQWFAEMSAQQDTSLSRMYVVSSGQNLDNALAIHNKVLASLESCVGVARISGVGEFVPSQGIQESKIEKWNEFWRERREPFHKLFIDEAVRQGFKEDAFKPLLNTLYKNYEIQDYDSFQAGLGNLISSYISVEDDRVLVYDLVDIKKEYLNDVQLSLDAISSSDIMAFADSSIAEKLVAVISGDFDKVLYLCGFIVFAFLLFSFGCIELTIIAFLPLAFAWIWILSIMGVSGMTFNIVNVILATFIFGMGDDYSIFVTEGAMYEYRTGRKMLPQFKNSIMLSAIIMFIAIGTLIFAKHPAMKSLAQVTMIGMVSVIVMAYIIPPTLFNALVKRNGRPRLIPITLKSFVTNIYALTVFLFFAILALIYGFVLLTLLGKTQKHKEMYHKAVCATFRLFSKMMPAVPCHIDNKSGEDFSKPAIVICNHQSQLDLLYTIMLSPKIIAVTNDWVWRCPFYGWIIRYCDFVPIKDRLESCIDILEERIKEGYSILIFPEGTRSPDRSVQRFHQGAFYLADKLNVDVLPIILHGVGHIMPKQEFYLRSGSVNIRICERISVEKLRLMGDTNVQRASEMRRFYSVAYAEMTEKFETVSFYRSLVYHNYIYKGADVQRQCCQNLKLKVTGAELLATDIPKNGYVLLENCGQGEISLLLALARKDVRFVAKDNDPFKIEIAKNCISVPANLVYTTQLINDDFTDIIDLNKL